ncbi:MAG: hypothetical protein UHG68_08805 [Clostridia bacterium]|nr:hypothetical protein [Clostridia bacterium]
MILDDMWMPYGWKPYTDEIRISPKRCGMTRKQWEKKKRERKNRKKARKHK